MKLAFVALSCFYLSSVVNANSDCPSRDDWSWRLDGGKKACGWVRKKPNERCLVSTGAKEACGKTCCGINACRASDDWTFKVDGKKGRACGWVGKSPNERCLVSTGAKKACGKTCCGINDVCDAYVPSFTLLGLNGITNPWPSQCTYDPDLLAGDALFDPANDPCWCIPDGLSQGCCPDPGERPVDYGWQVAEAFLTYVETSEPLELTPKGCDPWYDLYSADNFTGGLTGMTGACDILPSFQYLDVFEEPVCAFVYPEEDMDVDGTCGPKNRQYEMKTYGSFEAAEMDGAVVTHYGACGLCSNARDLSVMMDPRTV